MTGINESLLVRGKESSRQSAEVHLPACRKERFKSPHVEAIEKGGLTRRPVGAINTVVLLQAFVVLGGYLKSSFEYVCVCFSL